MFNAVSKARAVCQGFSQGCVEFADVRNKEQGVDIELWSICGGVIIQVVEELKALRLTCRCRCEELVSACGNRSVDRDA